MQPEKFIIFLKYLSRRLNTYLIDNIIIEPVYYFSKTTLSYLNVNFILIGNYL